MTCLQVEASTSGITAVSLTPDSSYVIAAAADGSLSLLEQNKAGCCLSKVECRSPLHCCITDGSTAVTGSEEGKVNNAVCLQVIVL